MIKKIITSMSIVCIIVASLAMISFAYYYICDRGCTYAYDGSGWYSQGWAEVSATGSNYVVTVGVKKNGLIYGLRNTVVSNGYITTCYSYKVYGLGNADVYLRINPQ